MGLVSGLILLVLGALSASSSIIAKRPDAQAYIDKLVPYQGWLGFIACIWGAWIIVNSLLNLGWLSVIPIWWITVAATGVLQFSLGSLLGYALISKYVLSKNTEAMKRGEQIRMKVVPYQVTLGWVSIGVGIWTIVANFLFLHL
jgi:hypothetical protein